MSYLFIIVAFTLNAFANILLKMGAIKGLVFDSYNPIILLVSNWKFLLGLLLFASNAFFYFLALKNLPISIAYPVMVVASFVIINLYAIFFLKETISLIQIFGYFLIIVGLVLVVSNIK